MTEGYVDIIQRDRIEGWAADRDAPDETLELVVLINGYEAGRVMADLQRRDLQRLGKYGDGRHGFAFYFPAPLDPHQEYDIVVRVADRKSALIQGAFKVPRQEELSDLDEAPAVEFCDWSTFPKISATVRPRYVLHVGLPKTGTKYLQLNFWNLRQQLREKGVYYPSQWWEEGPLFAHHALAEDLRHRHNARTAEALAALNTCGEPIVLLSSEGFYGSSEEALGYLRSLTDGAQIDVVVYARRWSDWIPSQWQQAVKQGAVEMFPEWSAVLLSTADHHPGINQARFLEKFSRVFSKESIRLISYSNLMDHGVDLFEHFCTKILYLAQPLSPSNHGDLVHESMGIFLTELIRGLNTHHALGGRVPGYQIFQNYQRIAAQPEVADDVKLLFAAMERHIGELTIDDTAGLFDRSYDQISAYRDALVSPEYGDCVFTRKVRRCRYVRPDYLMQPGAAAALERLARLCL